jgi:hypothetical protein
MNLELAAMMPGTIRTQAPSQTRLPAVAHQMATQQAGPRNLPYLIASAAAIAAAALTGTVPLMHRRKAATTP